MAGMGVEAGVLDVIVAPKLAADFAKRIADGVAPAAEKAGQTISQKLAGGFSKAGSALTKSVTLPLAGIATAAVQAGLSVDDALDGIRVKTGATGAELAQLTEDFKAVAKNSTQPIERVGEAIGELNNRLGLSGAPLQKLAAQVTDLEQITGETADLDNFTKAINAFGIPAEQAGSYLDKLFRAAQVGGVSVNDLTGTLSKQAAALGQLGFSFEESAGLMAQLTKAGVNADGVMGGLRKSLAAAAKAGKDPNMVFTSTVDKIQQLTKAGKDAEAAKLAKDLFGARGYVDALKAIQSGNLDTRNIVSQINNGTDSISGLAAETADFPEQLQRFKNQMTVGLAPLGQSLFPAISSAIESVLPAVIGLLDAFNNLSPGTQGVIVKVAALAAAIGPAATAIGKIVGIAGNVSKAIKALNAVLLANPWVLLAAAAVAAVILIVKYWKPISRFFADAFKGLAAAAKWAWDIVLSGVKVVVGASGIGLLIKLAGVVRDNWGTIAEFFTGLWDGIKNVFTGAYDFVVGIFDKIRGAISGMADAIKSIPVVGTVIDVVGSIVGKATGGPVTGNTPYVVGERGPELFVPQTSGTIVPNNALAGVGARSGDTNYQITIMNPKTEPSSTSLPNAVRRANYLKDAAR